MKVKDTTVILARSYEKFKRGDNVKIGDLIDDSDIWEITKAKGTYAIKHNAVERIAHLLEIEVVNEEWLVKNATLDNRMRTFCRFTVRMPIITKDGDRIGWSDPSIEIGIGSADDFAGSEYMARKRAYDRAVLNLIGLFDVYSDIEAEALKKDADTVVKVEDLPAKEREPIGVFIDELLKAKTLEDIDTTTSSWRERLDKLKVSDNAKSVLRHMVQTKRQQIQEKF